jgi:hypothetical protein
MENCPAPFLLGMTLEDSCQLYSEGPLRAPLHTVPLDSGSLPCYPDFHSTMDTSPSPAKRGAWPINSRARIWNQVYLLRKHCNILCLWWVPMQGPDSQGSSYTQHSYWCKKNQILFPLIQRDHQSPGPFPCPWCGLVSEKESLETAPSLKRKSGQKDLGDSTL